MKKVISKGKFERMNKLSNDQNIIDALALDQRGSLVNGMKKHPKNTESFSACSWFMILKKLFQKFSVH